MLFQIRVISRQIVRAIEETYSQSTSRLCVNLNMNSSTIRSIPTVRLMSSSSVSSALLKTKWSE